MKVIATSSYSGQAINKNFRFQILYQTKDNFIYLRNNIPLKDKLKWLHSEQLRHYIIGTPDKDISISLTSYSGNPQLYVSANPKMKIPGRLSHDFTTMNQKGSNGERRSIFVSKESMLRLNPYCTSSFEEAQEPCALFISLYCLSSVDCSFDLLLTYDNQTQQPLKLGVPINSFVQGSSMFKYYYVTLSDSPHGDLRAILKSDS